MQYRETVRVKRSFDGERDAKEEIEMNSACFKAKYGHWMDVHCHVDRRFSLYDGYATSRIRVDIYYPIIFIC